MKSRHEKSYHYKASGLPNVVLAGIEIRTCPSCGEEEVVIPRIEELHRLIARGVMNKPARLTGQEMRFLSKAIGLSGVDFAARVGVSPETVSRWENDKEPIGPTADRLVRLMAAQSPPKTDYALDELANIADEVKPLAMRLEPRARGWATAAAL